MTAFCTFNNVEGSSEEYFNFVLNILAYSFIFEIDDWSFEIFQPLWTVCGRWNMPRDERDVLSMKGALTLLLLKVLFLSVALCIYFAFGRVMVMVVGVCTLCALLPDVISSCNLNGEWQKGKWFAIKCAFMAMVCFAGTFMFADYKNVLYGASAAFLALWGLRQIYDQYLYVKQRTPSARY